MPSGKFSRRKGHPGTPKICKVPPIYPVPPAPPPSYPPGILSCKGSAIAYYPPYPPDPGTSATFALPAIGLKIYEGQSGTTKPYLWCNVILDYYAPGVGRVEFRYYRTGYTYYFWRDRWPHPTTPIGSANAHPWTYDPSDADATAEISWPP